MNIVRENTALMLTYISIKDTVKDFFTFDFGFFQIAVSVDMLRQLFLTFKNLL